MKDSLKLVTAFALSALMLGSCNNGSDSGQREEMKDTLATALDTTPEIMEGEVSYTLPSPLQIAAMFKKSGLDYYSGITNNTGNVVQYKRGSQFVEALNLGVYSADLSYCILNKQTEASKEYFKACKDLASELGLAKPFESIAKRLEKNLANEDSMALILASMQMEIDNILASSDQEHVSVITFAGAWIESMYIGTQVHAKEGHKNMASRLVEQMGIAENILKALKANASRDIAIQGLIRQISSLNDIYNDFKAIKEIKAKDPEVIDASKLSISLKELYYFADRLTEIRKEITKG